MHLHYDYVGSWINCKNMHRMSNIKCVNRCYGMLLSRSYEVFGMVDVPKAFWQQWNCLHSGLLTELSPVLSTPNTTGSACLRPPVINRGSTCSLNSVRENMSPKLKRKFVFCPKCRMTKKRNSAILDEIFALLVYYAAVSGSSVPTFRNNLSSDLQASWILDT